MRSFRCKKSSGDHSTLIDVAYEYVPRIVKWDCIKSVSPGAINTGPKAAGGKPRAKICREVGAVKVVFRQASSAQDVRFYTEDIEGAMLAIARLLRNNEIPISFS